MKLSGGKVELVDFLKVKPASRKDNSASVEVAVSEKVQTVECDILIVGGGTAGVAAALAATACGDLKVCLTEETDWLGGQMTAQGVPITDDGRNFQVETSGANRSYQKLRESIRNHYKENYKLTKESEKRRFFNPGNCWYWVSQLTFEPKVAVSIIDQLLSVPTSADKLKLFMRTAVIQVERQGDTIESMRAVNLDTGASIIFKAKFFIDSTELGDLLALSGAPYTSGVESKAETGERSAPDKAQPEAVQDYTYPFIVEFVPCTNNTIAKPPLYEHFREQGRLSLLNYKMFGHGHKTNSEGVIISELMPFWTYRRILDKSAFAEGQIPNDVAVINWYSNDFQGHNLIDKEPSVVSQNLSLAKSLSLSFLYWLQTEAPRDEGGKGYPELRLVVDALGSEDGLSKYPYIRESRRGKAITIIKEQQVKPESESAARAELFEDSVGIGFFPIDIHGQGVAPGTLRPTRPFQIPLGALVLNSPSNLLLSCKNIGATHITSAAYRLHPIEWAIGEASGFLAAFAIQSKTTPQSVLKELQTLRALQYCLIRSGAPLYWYDDVPTSHTHFEAVQLLAVLDIMRGDHSHLHFFPDLAISNEEAQAALERAKKVHKELKLEIDDSLNSMTRAEFASWLSGHVLKLIFENPVHLLVSCC